MASAAVKAALLSVRDDLTACRVKSSLPPRASYPARCRLSRRQRSKASVWLSSGSVGAAKTARRYVHCGLTRKPRPLYSAGFATLLSSSGREGPCGGIGRRARLKIEFRKECWFDSGQGHQKRSVSWLESSASISASDQRRHRAEPDDMRQRAHLAL